MTRRRPTLCAIVPAYDAAATLPEVLAGVERWGMTIIVVDDGSRDRTREWLERWRRDGDGGSTAQDVAERRRIVIAREVNGGKAAALRDGFARAIELGFDGAVTIDADGQHDPADGARLIERFVERFVARPDVPAIVCGERSAATPGYPLRNLAGRRLNDLAIRAATGVRVSDCPCGLRVYPLESVRRVRCISGRYAWEEEFLTRAIWAGFMYERVPIRCIYGDGDGGEAMARDVETVRAPAADDAAGGSPTGAAHREAGAEPRPTRRHTSHYRFRRDWPEAFAVNFWLLAIVLLPPAPTRRGVTRFVRQVIGALAPARAIDHLAGDSPSRLHGAATMAIGAASLGIASAVHDAEVPWTAWLVPALAAWAVVRLHASLLLAALGAGVAWGAARGMSAAMATSGGSAAAASSRVEWSAVGASLAPFAVAGALLVVPSVIALRRRAP